MVRCGTNIEIGIVRNGEKESNLSKNQTGLSQISHQIRTWGRLIAKQMDCRIVTGTAGYGKTRRQTIAGRQTKPDGKLHEQQRMYKQTLS